MDKNITINSRHRISQMARLAGLSRSALLYYDSIGLLQPLERSPVNYRICNDADRNRLEVTCSYRRTGMSLQANADILAAPRKQTVKALERMLKALNREIHELRSQLQTIVALLKDQSLLDGTRVLDKQLWVAVLHGAGLDDASVGQWHMAFEPMPSEAHQDFLESLGIAEAENTEIRLWSAQQSG